jgi:hypothetical protein
VWAICTAVSIGAALAGVFWYWANGELCQAQNVELRPIAALLQEDQEQLKALQSNAAPDKAFGILGSYLANIRSDGVPKHAEMKQRLDRLAENNAGILALIDLYAPRAKTAAFSTEAEKFRRYAIAWRDRWNSVMELFMAGGNYPFSEVPFPQGFAAALDAEIEATK